MNKFSDKGRKTSAYEFFTGGTSKTADFAIYYNIAFERMVKLKKFMKEQEWSSEKTYSYLAEYLWKAHLERKNDRGYEVTTTDKHMIDTMILKLEQIRNYHSHAWHDNEALCFSEDLFRFVKEKYDKALSSLATEDPAGVADYEALQKEPSYKKFTLFNRHEDGRPSISQEGRIFFLSFFLSSGQMSQFLQQRKGSKRTDMPLFKIKHKLYKYYCHRDGAAMFHIHHESTVFDSLPQNEQQQLLKARTAFKLISYLHDYPTYIGEVNQQSNPTEVRDIGKVRSLLEQHLELLPGFIPEEDPNPEVQSEFIRHRIPFKLAKVPGFQFEADAGFIHRLITLTLIHHKNSSYPNPLEALEQNLTLVAADRRALFTALVKEPSQRTPEEETFLLERKNQYLRGSRWLTEQGIIFFERLFKGLAENRKDALALAAAISPLDGEILSKYEPESIIVHINDLVGQTDRKFRTDNHFSRYVAQFLMDFAGDRWYWGMETFEMGRKNENQHESLLKKKKYFKASEIPSGYRLTVENEHIYWALPMPETNNKPNVRNFFQFTIGRQALKYLTAFCCQSTDDTYPQKLATFLENLLDDLMKIHEQGGFDATQNYNLLEDAFVPAYLKPATQNGWPDVDRKIQLRVRSITDAWTEKLKQLSYLRRAEKNRLVMDAYRMFDWPTDSNDVPKFFRQQEYNYMSICHYCLRDKQKANHLFQRTFALSTRRPSIPQSVVNHFKKAEDLESLLYNVITDRKAFLFEQLDLLSVLHGPALKTHRTKLCRILDISIPSLLRKTDEQDKLSSQRRETFELLPFPIHPMMIVKGLFQEKFNEGKKSFRLGQNKNGEIKLHEPHNIFNDLRKNKSLRRGLFEPHYSYEIAEAIYPEGNGSKAGKRLVGLINDTLTEDIILWWMAKQYLTGNPYTRDIGESLKKNQATDYHVGNLHAVSIKLPLGQTDKNVQLYSLLLMHQLDDAMFRTEKDYMRQAAIHYRYRSEQERSLWTDEELFSDKLQEPGIFPNGTHLQPIPFDILREEISFIRRTGRKFTDSILAFEHRVLKRAAEQLFNGDIEQLHEELRLRSGVPETNNFYHLNFKKVLDLARTIRMEGIEEIAAILDAPYDYRNIALHNDIPAGTGSFSWITRQGTDMRRILEISEDLHAKKDRTQYEIVTPSL